MSTLTPSFRFPNYIPDDAAHPAVVKGLRDTFKALTDIYSAIPLLKAQTTIAQTTANTAMSSGGGGSTPPVPFPFPGLGATNNQSGVTAYTTATTDNGILLILSDASPVAVTLNSALTTPYFLFLTNLGAGTATLTPSTGTINGAASFTLPQNFLTIAAFDGINWHASALVTLPQTFTPITHEWLNSYSAATGLFTATQPAFTDISGQIATSQLPPSGLSVTITTAALTTLGTQGSMTFTNGILTAQVQAT